MKEHIDVFITAMTIVAAIAIGGLVIIGLLWVAKQVL